MQRHEGPNGQDRPLWQQFERGRNRALNIVIAGIVPPYENRPGRTVVDVRTFETDQLFVSQSDIYCSPAVPVLDAHELQDRLSVLARTLEATTGRGTQVEPFEALHADLVNAGGFPQARYDLKLGKVHIDEKLSGTVITEEKRLKIDDQAREALESVGFRFGQMEEAQQIPVLLRTTFHMYPTTTCAERMYEYAQAPQTWEQRKDWYDYDGSFYEIFRGTITAGQLYELQRGGDIFWNEPTTVE